MAIPSIRTLALATTLLVAAPAGSALAGGAVPSDSEIKIRESFPAFHGKVLAEDEPCVAERTVKLFKLRRSADKKLLGKAITDAGKWEVLVDPLKSGSYFAVVQQSLVGSDGITYDCKRAKSKSVAVD